MRAPAPRAPAMDLTTAERFEYKYWIPEHLAEELLRFSAPHLRGDERAGRDGQGAQPGGQRNTSLYLDSPELDFLTAHVDSAPDRLKLRVRAYGDPPAGPAFFEIKRKVKAVTQKRRAVVPMEAVAPLLTGAPVPGLSLGAEEERTLSSFLYLQAIHHATPRVLITCRREAFSGLDPAEGVRLTLDRDICYQPAPGPTLLGDPRAWVRLTGIGNYEASAATLIELKFRGVAPFWVEALIERLHLSQSSFSKYVAAMTHEGLGPDGIDGLGGLDSRPAPRSRRSA